MLPTRIARAAALLLALAALPSPGSGQDSASAYGLRDARYCELIAVRRDGLALKATVYNTLGRNDCPDALWRTITAGSAKAALGALEVRLNGPRHWVLDGILAGGASADGQTVTVDGLDLTSRAVIDLSLRDLRPEPYSVHRIGRTTQWLYSGGSPIFVLTGPDGARYVMQSYAQIVDPALSYEDLAGLGDRLTLPGGWSFAVETPDADLAFPAEGEALVIQDDLDNTYQRMPDGT